MDEVPLFSYLFSAPLVRANIDGSFTEVDILDYVTERRELKILLEKKAGGNMRWKSEVANVHNFLNAYSNSRILHFTGHGEHGVMAFEDRFGKLKFISQTELSEMCGGLTDKPECIFLSACFAQTFADAFVIAGIKHIITVTNDRVLDKANLEFTDTFYSALISGKSVVESFNLGIARLVAHYPSERLKFDMKGSGDHSEVLFSPSEILSARPLVDETLHLPCSQCNSPAQFSVGRNIEVQQVYGLLRNGMKMINLTGQRGIGKTEVAIRVAEYARERYTFSRLLQIEFDKIPYCSEKICLEKITNAFNVSPASVFDIIEHVDMESAVEVIRGSVRPEEKVLLIVDGVDSWMRKKREFMISLVVRLRQRLGDVLWIILTSQQYIEMDSCREVVIERLSDLHTAHLFVLAAPRSMDRDELTLEANEAHKDPIQAFAKTKLLQSMKGNPKVVALVAKELQYDGHAQNMMRYETYFREEIIPSIMAQVLFFSSDLPTWQDVCVRLRNIYRRAVGIEACRARALTVEDMDFFAQCAAWGNCDYIPAKNRYVVVPSSLDHFLMWFEGILTCIKSSGLWSRPHCVFGFIDRVRAAELLSGKQPGTFLIGVSQGEPCLVINVVTSTGKVLPVKVKVDTTSPAPFSYGVNHGMTNCFMTLEDLLISNPQLQYFMPSCPDVEPISKLTLLPQT